MKEIRSPEALMRWRREVIETVFGVEPSATLLEANLQYYRRHVSDGTHLAMVASVDGVDAGCGAICFSEELPSPDNPSGRCAFLMNIFVREPYRGHGVGHAIVGQLITEARKRGCDKIYLESTPEARSLYEGLGFKDLPEMMKYGDIHNS